MNNQKLQIEDKSFIKSNGFSQTTVMRNQPSEFKMLANGGQSNLPAQTYRSRFRIGVNK